MKSVSAGTNWREKSVISSRSLPSTQLKRPSHYSQVNIGSRSGQGIGESLASRSRETTRLRLGRSAERLPITKSFACQNPREGIFVKRMQVSSPEPSAYSLRVDQVE